MNTTTVATAVQRRWACHTRTMLPTDAYGRQRCNVVLSDVLFYTCGVCPRLCARERGQQKQTKFYRYARTKWASCRETREIVLSTPVGKKNFERLPRELQCSDRAQTSTNMSGRASRVGVLSVSPKSAHAKRYVRKKTNFLQLYICIQGSPSGSGMFPAG